MCTFHVELDLKKKDCITASFFNVPMFYASNVEGEGRTELLYYNFKTKCPSVPGRCVVSVLCYLYPLSFPHLPILYVSLSDYYKDFSDRNCKRTKTKAFYCVRQRKYLYQMDLLHPVQYCAAHEACRRFVLKTVGSQ